MSEITDRVNLVVNDFDARVQAAPAGSWGNASPCEGWSARDVVVHVADNLLRIGGGVLDTENAPVGADEDINAAWGRAKTAIAEAMATGDLTKSLPGPFGPMPAQDLLGRLITTDVLVHTWDLARAVGGDEKINADVVSGAYSGLKPMDAMIRMPGVMGPKIDPPAGADEQTEFLCFLGRTV